MIAVIDYGAGNLRNVCKALEHVGRDTGAQIVLTDNAREIEHADKVVLPGVGAFADCQMNLKSRGLFEPTRAVALAGKPLLGICVGMQLLFDVGEEMGEWEGLGLIRGHVAKFGGPQFEGAHRLKVPHIGWNQLTLTQQHPLDKRRIEQWLCLLCAFVSPAHRESGACVGDDEYGYDFPAIVAKDNVWGIQFHPEKVRTWGYKC